MKLVITGCNHAVDFETLEEKVYLNVQLGEVTTEIETTEAGLHAVLELVGQSRLEPAVAAARTEAEATMAGLEEDQSVENADGDGVVPFGFGGTSDG